MFTRSVTPATPLQRVRSHAQLSESTTWVHEWYALSDDSSAPLLVKLKGWHKTRGAHEPRRLRPDDTLDLLDWRYYAEAPVVDHPAIPAKPGVSATPSGTATPAIGAAFELKSELKNAFSLDKDQGSTL